MMTWVSRGLHEVALSAQQKESLNLRVLLKYAVGARAYPMRGLCTHCRRMVAVLSIRDAAMTWGTR